VTSAVLEWIPGWENDESNSYRGATAIVNIGAIEGGFGWRLAHTAPPICSSTCASRRRSRWESRAANARVRALARRAFSRLRRGGRVYVTAPGAEIDGPRARRRDRRIARGSLRRPPGGMRAGSAMPPR
jgi:hypothetical protein